MFCWPQRKRKQRCALCVITQALKMSLIERRDSTLKHSSGEYSRLPTIQKDTREHTAHWIQTCKPPCKTIHLPVQYQQFWILALSVHGNYDIVKGSVGSRLGIDWIPMQSPFRPSRTWEVTSLNHCYCSAHADTKYELAFTFYLAL